jgi:hypothetical protein
MATAEAIRSSRYQARQRQALAVYRIECSERLIEALIRRRLLDEHQSWRRDLIEIGLSQLVEQTIREALR